MLASTQLDIHTQSRGLSTIIHKLKHQLACLCTVYILQEFESSTRSLMWQSSDSTSQQRNCHLSTSMLLTHEHGCCSNVESKTERKAELNWKSYAILFTWCIWIKCTIIICVIFTTCINKKITNMSSVITKMYGFLIN